MREITRQILAEFNLPCAWDINRGWCEAWALKACEKFGGKVFWLDQIPEYRKHFNKNSNKDESWDPPHYHAVLFLNGKYYDSLHPDGVESVLEMDFVRGLSRNEFLKKNEV